MDNKYFDKYIAIVLQKESNGRNSFDCILNSMVYDENEIDQIIEDARKEDRKNGDFYLYKKCSVRVCNNEINKRILNKNK